MKLIKGNEENLEGRVVIFSRFDPRDSGKCMQCNNMDGNVLAVYAFKDISELSDRMGLSLEKMKAQVEASQSRFPKEDLVGWLYASLPVISTEQDVNSFDGDILHSGDYSCSVKSVSSLTLAMNIYLLDFSEQLIRKTGVNFTHVQEEKSKYVLYDRQMDAAQLKATLTQQYVGPLLDAAYRRDEKYFEDLKKDLIIFGVGSPLQNDVLSLAESISSSRTNPNLKLVELYLDKIVAIHSEDYLAAKAKNDQIKELLKR